MRQLDLTLTVLVTKYLFPSNMPRTEKKTLGIGAECGCLARFLHPRAAVNTKYTNSHHMHHIDGLIVLKQELKKVNHKEQMCIFFQSPQLPQYLSSALCRTLQ